MDLTIYNEEIESLIGSMTRDIKRKKEDVTLKRRHIIVYISRLKKLQKDIA